MQSYYGAIISVHNFKKRLRRQIESASRCTTGGIDHAFVNWLVYGEKLAPFFKTKVFPMGEGAVNSLGGLNPDTVLGNITGPLHDFLARIG